MTQTATQPPVVVAAPALELFAEHILKPFSAVPIKAAS